MNSIWYLVKQGFKNTFKNAIMSFASIGVLFSCLFLIGTAVLFSLNLNKVINDIEQQNEFVIFLNDDVSDEQIDDISVFLSRLDFVDKFEFIDKDEALNQYIKNLGDDTALYENLKDDNPLPHTYSVVLSDLSYLEDYVEKIGNLDGVEKINAPIEVAKMMLSIQNAVNIAGMVLISILLCVALVIISNTVKLTIYSRRKEINIMKYVGASDFFIKLPFVVEGLFIGVVSAGLAHTILWTGYNYLMDNISEIQLQWVSSLHNSMVPFSDYNLMIFGGFLAIGSLVGIMGSSFFVRKYLKV